VPERATDRESEAPSLIVMEPLEATPEVGANFTVNWLLFPAFKVRGRENPVNVKPVPATLAWEIVTLVVPVFASVTLCEVLAPTATFPKASVPGVAVSWELPLDVEAFAGTKPQPDEAATARMSSANARSGIEAKVDVWEGLAGTRMG
jgi:hypothetical protein